MAAIALDRLLHLAALLDSHYGEHMLQAPNLDVILWRLRHVPHSPWGPDGVRYVSILFWDEQGYRALYNGVDDAAWKRWSVTSGETWDLFLAGCYQYQS